MSKTNRGYLRRNFAANIKEERLRQSLSQEALASRAGVSVSYVSMLERDQRSPPLETVEAFAAALNVPAVGLLEEPRTAAPARRRRAS